MHSFKKMEGKINFNLFKKKVVINMTNRAFYSFIVFGVLILLFTGFFVVNAYGTNNPAVFGHSAGEIEGVEGGDIAYKYGKQEIIICDSADHYSAKVFCPIGYVAVNCARETSNLDKVMIDKNSLFVGVASTMSISFFISKQLFHFKLPIYFDVNLRC